MNANGSESTTEVHNGSRQHKPCRSQQHCITVMLIRRLSHALNGSS